MRPRLRLALGVGLAAAALAALAEAGPAGSPRPVGAATADIPPNVIVVMTDDQDAASLAAMPRVRRLLVDRGTTFTNAFATFPLCCPSRATFLTGQYAHNHGVRSNEPPLGSVSAFDDANTLPVWLRGAGYRTAMIGKYLNRYGGEPAGAEVPPGWSDWHVLTTPYQMYGYTLSENGALHSYGSTARDYQTDVLARKALAFLRSGDPARPYFLAVTPVAPHAETVLPTNPPAPRNPRPAPRDAGAFSGAPLPRTPSFNEADVSDKPSDVGADPPLTWWQVENVERKYRSRMESLLAVDRLVSRLVREVRRAGELDRTVFVFTSDNGYLLGEHRQRAKSSVYEESVRVPLVVRGRGFARGETEEGLAANIDLAPTIAELAGIAPGRRVDGLSLVDTRERSRFARRRAILLEELEPRNRFAAVRTGRWMLSRTLGEWELYDLRADPFQLRSLASEPETEAVRRRLQRRLARLRHCQGRACG